MESIGRMRKDNFVNKIKNKKYIIEIHVRGKLVIICLRKIKV